MSEHFFKFVLHGNSSRQCIKLKNENEILNNNMDDDELPRRCRYCVSEKISHRHFSVVLLCWLRPTSTRFNTVVALGFHFIIIIITIIKAFKTLRHKTLFTDLFIHSFCFLFFLWYLCDGCVSHPHLPQYKVYHYDTGLFTRLRFAEFALRCLQIHPTRR